MTLIYTFINLSISTRTFRIPYFNPKHFIKRINGPKTLWRLVSILIFNPLRLSFTMGSSQLKSVSFTIIIFYNFNRSVVMWDRVNSARFLLTLFKVKPTL